MPVSWSELSPALTPNGFTLETLPKRLAGLKHDPWAERAAGAEAHEFRTLAEVE